MGSQVFFCHLQGKEPEQQDDVFAAFAEWRHLHGDGVQTIIEILAEPSLADSFLHVHVGGSHDAHVGLHHLGAAHADILTRFEHAQQSSLGGQRQFAYLVEEDGAFVGHAEIAFAFTDCTCKGTFLMTE